MALVGPPCNYFVKKIPGFCPSNHIRLQYCQIPRCQQQQQDSLEPPAPRRSAGGSFVKPSLEDVPGRRTAPCRRCGGSGTVPCAPCDGIGRLGRGGYQKRNPVNPARVIGSKWTAMERSFGWRHFRVSQKCKEGSQVFVLMVSTCDSTTQFWLALPNLRDRERWSSGWLQKAEIQALEQGPAAANAAECKACGGSGLTACPLCSLAGQVVEL